MLLHLTWGCTYCWSLPKLKINSLQGKQAEARERALESSPSLHLQDVDFWLLIKNNKIHTSDILKMVQRILVLKLNTYVYPQPIVTKGLTGPTSLITSQPSASSHAPSCQQLLWQSVSEDLSWHQEQFPKFALPFARGQFTDWDMASVRGAGM